MPRSALKTLSIAVKNLQKEMGGISHIIGYKLEEKFYHLFPDVLREDFKIELRGDVERRFILYPDGRDDEINIYGEGRLDGREIRVIGESKAQIGKGDVRDFTRLIKRVKDISERKQSQSCYAIRYIPWWKSLFGTSTPR